MKHIHTPEYTNPHFRILKKRSYDRFSTRRENILQRIQHHIPDNLQEFIESQKPKSKSKPGFSPASKVLKETRVSVLKISPSLRKFTNSQNERKVPLNMLTTNESQEIKNIMNKHLNNEIDRAKNRLNRRIDSMNKFGILSGKANEAREESLLSLETSLM